MRSETPRWEYMTSPPMATRDMNAYGRDGWELVAVVTVLSANSPRVELYWKGNYIFDSLVFRGYISTCDRVK